MTEAADRGPGSSGPGRAVGIAGGVLLALAVFLPWYFAPSAGGAGTLTGLALSAKAPELGILPALGLAAAAAGAVMGRLPRGARDAVVPPAAVVVGLLGLAVAFEVGFRLAGTLQSLYGPTFWDGAGLGWYAAVLGAFLILAAGALRWLIPSERSAVVAA